MRTKLSAMALVFLALFAPIAGLMGIPVLKAIALATQASPAMKVFTSHDGYETFSPRFHLLWMAKGDAHSLTLTPANYALLRGPYNRRNALGALLSYAPVLSAGDATRDMHSAAMRYALCDSAPVLRELGIDPATIDGPVTLHIEPRRPLDAKWNLRYEVNCHEQ